MALTKKDIEIINKMFEKNEESIIRRIVGYVDARIEPLATKEGLAEVKASIKFLPSKEEFFTRMDKLSTELVQAREEREVQSYRLSDHEDRLEIIETKLAITS